MEVYIALQENNIYAYDKEWIKVFPLFLPVHLFGGTEMIIVDKECEVVDSGILVRMHSPYYPPMTCLVTTNTLASLEKRKSTVEKITRDKSQVCTHSIDGAEHRRNTCPSCFQFLWTKKAKQANIKHECLQVKGKPLWMK
jgi:hypothetical protein